MSPFIDYATCNFKIKDPIKGIIQYDARKHHIELADLYDNNRFVLVKKYRQGGFSVMTALWALHECITKPNVNILFVIGQDREALDVKESIIDLALGLMPNKPDFLKSNNHELKLANGSHLTFFTPMACCGKRADNIIIDEAAFIKDLDCHYKALWPCVKDNGKIFLVSSISYPDGLFYETYKKALAWENNFKVYAPDCREAYTEEKLKEMKYNLGGKGFIQQCMAKYPGEL